MVLNTKHFGALDVDENRIIKFEHGIPGFPDDKRFIIVTDVDVPESLYCWLQSVDDGEVSLVLIDSFYAMPNYNPLVNEGDIEELGEPNLEDILSFNVAVIKANMDESTINLKAPIIINDKTKKGKQVIVTNDEYNIRHNLVECIKSEGKV